MIIEINAIRYMVSDNELASTSDAELVANASEGDANDIDDTLYLSKEYNDKTINDIYNMLVSVRNSVILLCMMIFLFEAHKILKNAFKKHYRA